jgi:hypothetical protein
MKATLSFDLSDAQDAQAHLRCVKAEDMAFVVWTFSGRLRRIVDKEEHSGDVSDAIWNAWNETLEDYGVKIDELIS